MSTSHSHSHQFVHISIQMLRLLFFHVKRDSRSNFFLLTSLLASWLVQSFVQLFREKSFCVRSFGRLFCLNCESYAHKMNKKNNNDDGGGQAIEGAREWQKRKKIYEHIKRRQFHFWKTLTHIRMHTPSWNILICNGIFCTRHFHKSFSVSFVYLQMEWLLFFVGFCSISLAVALAPDFNYTNCFNTCSSMFV